jgi:hypothetical protein
MFTTDDIMAQVRDQLQETNITTVSDETILRAINRGVDYAWNVYVRHYPDPLIVRSPVTSIDADGTFQIPDDAFEQRLQKVELEQAGIVYELERINYRRTTPYRNNVIGSRPVYYAIRGRTVELLPKPGSAFNFHAYYVRRPDRLRLQQGQVASFTAAGAGDASIVVDSVGSTLSTDDPYSKYVNFVDGKTGEIRGSAEIKTIDGQQITFKQTPTRSTVLGRSISGDIPSDLGVDDYITDIRGSCVVFLQQPTSNFLIQYAVSEIRRALGYDTGIEKSALAEFEAQVEHTWAGREASMRVKPSNRVWTKWRR